MICDVKVVTVETGDDRVEVPDLDAAKRNLAKFLPHDQEAILFSLVSELKTLRARQGATKD